MLKAILVITIPTLAVACGLNDKKPPKYKLEGSLTEFMNLAYDEARWETTQGSTDFAVLFIRYRGEDPDGGTPAGEDVPLKVTVRTGDLTLEQIELRDFDLATDAGNGGLDQRGILSRNVLNDPRRSFTTLDRGGLKVDRFPAAPGERTNGSFHVTFDPGIDFSSGRTIFGNFTAIYP